MKLLPYQGMAVAKLLEQKFEQTTPVGFVRPTCEKRIFSIKRGAGCFERAKHAQNTQLPPSFGEDTEKQIIQLAQ